MAEDDEDEDAEDDSFCDDGDDGVSVVALEKPSRLDFMFPCVGFCVAELDATLHPSIRRTSNAKLVQKVHRICGSSKQLSHDRVLKPQGPSAKKHLNTHTTSNT